MALSLFLPFFLVQAELKPMNIHIFTQTGCPHCASAISLLENMKNNGYPEIVINEFDMKANHDHIKKLLLFANAYQADPRTVPLIFIGDKHISGYLENSLREAIEYYHLPVNNYPDPQNIVDEYYQSHPVQSEQPAGNTKTEIVGWVVIGAIILGGGVILINKFF